MKALYPTALSETGTWAATNHVSVQEARVRFAQYGVLRAVASSQRLSRDLVLKGGNALDFVWSPNRSTKDLDFSALLQIEGDELRTLLQGGLDVVARQLSTLYRVQKVDRQPPGAGKTFITYAVTVGYAFPDQAASRRHMENGRPISEVIPLDVSLNDPVCAHESVGVDGPHDLLVSTREDILAEKLRSLLQQPIRNRGRRQDLLDIAVLLRGEEVPDLALTAQFLLRKAAARSVPVSRAAFHDPEVERRARQDYDALKGTTRTTFVRFEEALAALHELVAQLKIAER